MVHFGGPCEVVISAGSILTLHLKIYSRLNARFVSCGDEDSIY